MRKAVTAFALLLSWQRLAIAADAAPGEAPASAPASPDAAKTNGEVLLLRAAIVGSSEVTSTSKTPGRDTQTVARARQLDLALSDAAQDLGFTLDLSERGTQDERELSDLEVIARAAKGGRPRRPALVVARARDGGRRPCR